ncbi:MAG: universal stress protein [Rhodobacteraceae bacterium]|nr:universal stress protein [Paracoccaceae bacterium]
MFSKIMIPVDLAHEETLEKALKCGADMARNYSAPVVYVGVTSTTPSKTAHTPEEFGEKLSAFAARQADQHGIDGRSHVAIAHDPTTEIDDALLKAVTETGADLVVMASHIPNLMDYVWPSNGGKIAEHAKASVLVVRG